MRAAGACRPTRRRCRRVATAGRRVWAPAVICPEFAVNAGARPRRRSLPSWQRCTVEAARLAELATAWVRSCLQRRRFAERAALRLSAQLRVAAVTSAHPAPHIAARRSPHPFSSITTGLRWATLSTLQLLDDKQ